MLDVIVIGGGPAGLSASLNLKIRNKTFMVLGGTEKVTGLSKAPQIDNYLGLSRVSGAEMLEKFKAHANEMGIEIHREKVQNVLNMGDYFAVSTGTEFYDAKCLIIASGHGKADYMAGEKEYLGKGVGYCATCDGPLYKNKTVAIIAENDEGEEEANFMAEICAKVYYLPRYKMEGQYLKSSVTIIMDKIESIEGDGEKVTGLKLKNKQIETDAVFFIRNTIPADELLEGLVLEDGAIRVKRDMSTDIPGVFACGDCAGKPYQVAKATGEGVVAALSAVRYLDGTEHHSMY